MTAAAIDYDRAINIVRGDNVEERMALASDPRTPPEFLYYLSNDPDIGVRRAVGENPGTPGKADARLSRDDDVSVRCAVARKVVGEGLDTESRRDMWRMGFTILETLMRDNLVKVRRILTEAFRADAQAPRQMVLGLARDREEEIAAPVLRCSPVLTDEDIVSIMEEGPPDWAEDAIADRVELSPDLADRLITRSGITTVARVIANPGSALSPSALEALVDRSEAEKELQPPLVGRKNMSGGLLTKLAKFVAAPLLQTLCGRKDLDQQSVGAINSAIEARDDKPAVRAAAAKAGKAQAESDGPAANPQEARARQLFGDGKLADDVVATALDRWQNDFVTAALALRAGYPVEMVRRMVRVKSARTIVALAWKAGFTARFAMDLQRRLAKIPPTKIVNARDGVDYALSTADMEKQLAFFD